MTKSPLENQTTNSASASSVSSDVYKRFGFGLLRVSIYIGATASLGGFLVKNIKETNSSLNPLLVYFGCYALAWIMVALDYRFVMMRDRRNQSRKLQTNS